MHVAHRVIPVLALVLAGCPRTSPPPRTPPPVPEAAPEAPAEVEAADGDAAEEADEEEESAPNVVKLERAPIVGPAPRLRLKAPADGALIKDGPVMLKLAVEHWRLAPAPGNHVYVKVDNREGLVVRDVSAPISLDALYEKKFGEPLAEGSHVLRVFLRRPNHEGVKLPTAFKMAVFHYRSKTPDFSFDRRAPLLTYSRPQGCASDPARLLDFFITNLNALSEHGYKVHYLINGAHRGRLLGWSPYRIEGLGAGESTIRLWLVGPSGKPVPGPFNDTTRTVSGDRGCPQLGLIPDDPGDDDDEVLEQDEPPARAGRVPPPRPARTP